MDQELNEIISSQNEEKSHGIGLLSLPVEILHCILSFFSYDEISKLRLVSKRFDLICQELLNKGFKKAQLLVPECHRDIKSKLPKRESQRQHHPLKAHAEVLSALDTRLSLLDMTFSKCIDIGTCCFIPGLVLDEIFRIMRLVKTSPTMDRSHKVLKELRDISSMAMEHFDDVVLPSRKRELNFLSKYKYKSSQSESSSTTLELLRSTTNFISGNGDSPFPGTSSEFLSSTIKDSALPNYQDCFCSVLKIIDGIIKNQKQLTLKNNELQTLVKNQNIRIQHLESILDQKRSNEPLISHFPDTTSVEMQSPKSCSDSPPSLVSQFVINPDAAACSCQLNLNLVDTDKEIPNKRRRLT